MNYYVSRYKPGTVLFRVFLLGFILLLGVALSGCSSRMSQLEEKPLRYISFAGYTWIVKDHPYPVGPGPNMFSNSAKHVWVDNDGRLHLKVRKTHGRWTCAEVFMDSSLGFGEYSFTSTINTKRMDPNIVLGLFQYDMDAESDFHREIDIEFSTWGLIAGPNLFYTIHSKAPDLLQERFRFITTNELSIHSYLWQPGEVLFRSSVPGKKSENDFQAVLRGNAVPDKGNQRVHINLWLFKGNAPAYEKSFEVIIEDFVYTPLQTGTTPDFP